MRRILIVDDEQMLLDSLKNGFRRRNRDYQVEIALGGDAALALMQTMTFDVVVSDMRMPGMDGATFLAHVKRLYPTTARLMLSGGSDRPSMMRALLVAHQYLGKPFDFVLLQTTIERVCALGDVLANEPIRTLVGGLDKLPSLPEAFAELSIAITEERDLRAIGAIIERDAAMSAKVLQLVNSSYFGLGRPVSSVSQAVILLGAELLRALAQTAHVFSCVDAGALGSFSLDDWQRRSFTVARLARRLLDDPKKQETAFTAALMHDVGKIVLALKYKERMPGLAEAARARACNEEDLEKEWFAVGHPEAGSYLLGVWGLPFPVVEAVAFHHQPAAVLGGDRDVLAAVHFACSAIDQRPADLTFLKATGHADHLPTWQTFAAEATQAP